MATLESAKITKELIKKLGKYQAKAEGGYVGRVEKIADGVATISGLYETAFSEMVEFASGVYGVVIDLTENEIGVIILGDYLKIKEGDEVKATGKLLSVPVGEELIGRVIDPLGNVLDGKGSIKVKNYYPEEKIAPGVTKRQTENTSLQTGIKSIDAMTAIGRGQRELIIGDRGTGKTAIALDTIINQKSEDVICIYVAIGQKESRVAQVVETLAKEKALAHTIVVNASAASPASFQYLGKYTTGGSKTA